MNATPSPPAQPLSAPKISLTPDEEDFIRGFATRLHSWGPRVVGEALLDIARGQSLTEVIASFSRLDKASLYDLEAFVAPMPERDQ